MGSRVLQWALLNIVGLISLAAQESLSKDWSVTHVPSKICTLHHTTVVLPCKYSYPRGQVVTTSFWQLYKNMKGAEPLSVGGALGGVAGDCSLTLKNVTQGDAGIYQFFFRTNTSTQDRTNEHGVTLETTDLKVEMYSEIESDVVEEGSWVTLSCGTCIPSLTVPTYVWMKNGHEHSRINGNNLLDKLQVKREDTGSYSCSIGGHLTSSVVNFTVKSPPRDISVSISPSGEIVEGISVTLTCSSDADPPVEIYSWFKGSAKLGEGEIYSVLNISSEDSGEYTCQCQNQDGEGRSPAVGLNVLYPPKNVSLSNSSSGEIVEDISVILTCSSDANPPVENYTWFIEGGVSPVGSGHSYSPLQSGSYYCEARNEHGAQRSAPITLILKGGHSITLYVAVAVGAGLCVIAALLILALSLRRQNQKKDKTKTNKSENQEVEGDTYMALDPSVRASDVYQTLTNLRPDHPVTVNTSVSSDYENIETLNNKIKTSQC